MSGHFRINQSESLSYITLPALEDMGGIRHGFSIKENRGEQNRPLMDFTSAQARRRLMETLGLPPQDPAMVRQMHGDSILVIDENSRGLSPNRSIRADAMITDVRGLALALLTADCLPLLLVNRETGAVGIAHAGRRGTLLEIAAKTVGKMREVYGARPEDTFALLGPAIGPCCYEVGQDVADGFRMRHAWWEEVFSPGENGRFYLNLPLANRVQLLEAGVEGDRIIESGLCTSCESALFHSFRRDKGIKGHIFNFIMLTQ